MKFPKDQLYLVKRIIFIFLLSFKFKNFSLFMRYLCFIFYKNTQKQRLVIHFYKRLLKSKLFVMRNILGIQFSLKGKMNRRPRARRIMFIRGRKPGFQNLNLRVYYAARQFLTHFGTYYMRL